MPKPSVRHFETNSYFVSATTGSHWSVQHTAQTGILLSDKHIPLLKVTYPHFALTILSRRINNSMFFAPDDSTTCINNNAIGFHYLTSNHIQPFLSWTDYYTAETMFTLEVSTQNDAMMRNKKYYVNVFGFVKCFWCTKCIIFITSTDTDKTQTAALFVQGYLQTALWSTRMTSIIAWFRYVNTSVQVYTLAALLFQ